MDTLDEKCLLNLFCQHTVNSAHPLEVKKSILMYLIFIVKYTLYAENQPVRTCKIFPRASFPFLRITACVWILTALSGFARGFACVDDESYSMLIGMQLPAASCWPATPEGLSCGLLNRVESSWL